MQDSISILLRIRRARSTGRWLFPLNIDLLMIIEYHYHVKSGNVPVNRLQKLVRYYRICDGQGVYEESIELAKRDGPEVVGI